MSRPFESEHDALLNALMLQRKLAVNPPPPVPLLPFKNSLEDLLRDAMVFPPAKSTLPMLEPTKPNPFAYPKPTNLNEELTADVNQIIYRWLNIQEGRVVPTPEAVALVGGATKLEATFLYADLANSSILASEFDHSTTAKIIRAFLLSMSKLITQHGGKIVSFDGDRVLGVFVGPRKNTMAVKCALKMRYAVENIINHKFQAHFSKLGQRPFDIIHGVGIDSGQVLIVRVGHKGSNDLSWIGRAPNLAAKLSSVRETDYKLYISEAVFVDIDGSLKNAPDGEMLWEYLTFSFGGDQVPVYRTKHRLAF